MTNGIVLNLTVGLWSAIVLSVTAVVIYGIRAFVRLERRTNQALADNDSACKGLLASTEALTASLAASTEALGAHTEALEASLDSNDAKGE